MRLYIAAAFICVTCAIPAPIGVQWESECGVSAYQDAGVEPPATNIYGGWDARKGEWPWQVSMRNAESGANHYCGAVVINANWILTAAHCCEGELAVNVYTVVGEHDLDGDDASNPDRVVHRISNLIMHEEYGPVTLVNDACLLQTVNNISFSQFVQPACAPDQTSDYVGVGTSISGWGNTDGRPTSVLQTTNVETITNQVCYQDYYQNIDPTWLITQDMICAGLAPYNERDTCQGDSGGPMVFKNAQNRWEIVGLTSWGSGCAAGYPGVYHRVTDSLPWINSHIYA